MRTIFKIFISSLLIVIGAYYANITAKHFVLRVLSKAERVIVSNINLSKEPISAQPVFYMHRSRASVNSRGNSALSINECVRRCPRIEVDVSFSSDLIPFISHGDDLPMRSEEAQSRGMDNIEDYNSSVLKALKLDDSTTLLTLEEFISAYASSFDSVVLDIKASPASSTEKARMLSQLLPKADSARYLLLGLSGEVLMELKALRPELEFSCETYLALSNWLAGFQMLSIDFRAVSPALDSFAQFLGLKRFYWTANTESELNELMSFSPELAIVDLSGANPPLNLGNRFGLRE